MDTRRFRLYMSLIVVIFGVSIVRVLTQTNPIYDALEPVLTRLDDFSADVATSSSKQLGGAELQNAQNEQLATENEQLKQALQLKTERPSTTAQVTRRGLQSFRKFVWINVGSSDGITKDQTVLHQGSLFGLVEEVFDQSAIVRTVLDPDFRATAEIAGQQGVLKVDHGSLVLDLVPDKTLAGQGLRTDGLDGTTQTGVFVGTAERQIATESDVFGRYNVALGYSVYDVEFVEVLDAEEDVQ